MNDGFAAVKGLTGKADAGGFVKPDQAQSPSANLQGIQQSLEQQRRAISDVVQREGAEAGLPFVQEFRRHTAKLTAEHEALTKRLQVVLGATTTLGAAETDLRTKNDDLVRQQSALDKLAQFLGKAAFSALQAGHIKPHDAFISRVELQSKLDQLQKEYESLAAPPQASIIEKTKAGGQQLIVAGKIKLEEMKIGGIDNCSASPETGEARCVG